MSLTEPQRNALVWLAGDEVPSWYDSAQANTLLALERRGLVAWRGDGPRTYWVTPATGGSRYLDHWYPGLTDEGERIARELAS